MDRKRAVSSKKGSSAIRGRGQISPRVTICSLPDNVLVEIFDFSLPDPLDPLDQARGWAMQSLTPTLSPPDRLRAGAWSKLMHVYQRWRYIMLASLLRLNLRLLCTDRTPVRKMLDVWPPLPIETQCYSVDL
jgi:hypothetical protein